MTPPPALSAGGGLFGPPGRNAGGGVKRALLIVGALGLIVIAGLGAFLATFDADRYRPLVVRQLESALGKPVRLERVSLGWRGGLALQLKGLAVSGVEWTAQAEQVSATVRLLPLLRRQLQLSSLDIRDGRLRLRGLIVPIERLTVEATAGAERITLTQCSARMAGGTLGLTGAVERVTTQPSATIQATVEQVRLDALWPEPAPHQPRLRGTLNGSFTGSTQGLSWPQISRSLSGQGRLTLTDARIDHLNILREVFRRLSILPGVLEALQARLPPSYQARLDARDTILHPVDLQVTAADGALTFAELQLETDDLILKGAGRVGLDGTLAAQASVWVDPDLSAAIIRSVNELQSLADAQGRLELPVAVQGTLPRVAVLPDLGQLGSRLIVQKAQEVIGGLLQRALEKHLAPESASP